MSDSIRAGELALKARVVIVAYGWVYTDDQLWTRAAVNPSVAPTAVLDIGLYTGAPWGGDVGQIRSRVDQWHNRGLKTLGYIPTASGSQKPGRTLEDIEWMIDDFYDAIPLDGIFLDEGPSPGTATTTQVRSFYSALYKYIKAKLNVRGKLVWLNAAGYREEWIMDVANVITLLEEKAIDYLKGFSPPTWIVRYPPQRVAHVIHDTPETQLPQIVAEICRRRAGRVYIFDGSSTSKPESSNGYSRPPNYWEDELILVENCQMIDSFYRYWNPTTRDHFYTPSWEALGQGASGYYFESIERFVYPDQRVDRVPLYMYWSEETSDHFYTTDWNELRGGDLGYVFQGIHCYVPAAPTPDTLPLHRYWSPDAGDHFYTTNWSELGAGDLGYQYEGVACHVLASPYWRLDYAPIFARHSGRCLDVLGASGSNGAAIVQWDYLRGDNQKFRLEPLGDGYYRLVAAHSGKVIDVEGASTANGARVIQWEWWGGQNQQFRPEPDRDGYYKLVARHSGKCVDVSGAAPGNGAQIIQWDYGAGDNQKWRL